MTSSAILVLLALALLSIGLLVLLTAKIHAALKRLSTFLDAQDIDWRRERVEGLRVREVRAKTVDSFFKDTRAILGKLHTVAEELSVHRRDTVEMRAPFKMPALSPARAGSPSEPLPETTRKPDAMPASRERRAVAAPAAQASRSHAPVEVVAAPAVEPAPGTTPLGRPTRPIRRATLPSIGAVPAPAPSAYVSAVPPRQMVQAEGARPLPLAVPPPPRPAAVPPPATTRDPEGPYGPLTPDDGRRAAGPGVNSRVHTSTTVASGLVAASPPQGRG